MLVIFLQGYTYPTEVYQGIVSVKVCIIVSIKKVICYLNMRITGDVELF